MNRLDMWFLPGLSVDGALLLLLFSNERLVSNKWINIAEDVSDSEILIDIFTVSLALVKSWFSPYFVLVSPWFGSGLARVRPCLVLFSFFAALLNNNRFIDRFVKSPQKRSRSCPGLCVSLELVPTASSFPHDKLNAAALWRDLREAPLLSLSQYSRHIKHVQFMCLMIQIQSDSVVL